VTRNKKIVERYKAGETSVALALHYGVSRARIQQILAKEGIDRNDGGVRVRALEKSRIARNKQNNLWLRKFGVTWEQYRRFDTEVRRAFSQQRITAKRRTIEWQFTLASWWALWESSGKWEERGVGRGYCMARYKDRGPYSPENCYICTIGQNFKDARKWKRWSIHGTFDLTAEV
jgi:hypothetical protein